MLRLYRSTQKIFARIQNESRIAFWAGDISNYCLAQCILQKHDRLCDIYDLRHFCLTLGHLYIFVCDIFTTIH